MTYLLDTNAISDLMRAAPRIENWMAGLDQGDRVVTCTIVRGEVLFGIARLPAGRRRTELVETVRQFLATLRCEPVPERAGDFYAAVKAGSSTTRLHAGRKRSMDSSDCTCAWRGSGQPR